MLEQIKAMKYKKQYTYIAAGLAILAILYIFISIMKLSFSCGYFHHFLHLHICNNRNLFVIFHLLQSLQNLNISNLFFFFDRPQIALWSPTWNSLATPYRRNKHTTSKHDSVSITPYFSY